VMRLPSPCTVHRGVPGARECTLQISVVNRWDEKAGLRRDAVRPQVIDALEAQEIKETGNEED
jgi:hypothetical protein